MRENMRIVFASDDSERGDTPALQNLFGRRPFLRDVRRELVHTLQYPFFAAPDGDARRRFDDEHVYFFRALFLLFRQNGILPLRAVLLRPAKLPQRTFRAFRGTGRTNQRAQLH